MNIPSDIIDKQPESVRRLFVYWTEYMEKNISFSLYDSGIHTSLHCERVLLYSLILGQKILGENHEYMEVLSHASVFHDTRRQDDYLDRGHGAIAALYYRDFCEENGLLFHSDSFKIMTYHDQDDKLGIKAISEEPEFAKEDSLLLYSIFKDADALDRFRLGPWGLNPEFLRNKEALELMDFAKQLVYMTEDKEYMDMIMKLTREFKDRIEKGI